MDTQDIGRVGAIVGQWAKSGPLTPKDRIGTSEISHDSTDLEIYGYRADYPKLPSKIMVTGAIAGDLSTVRPKIEALHQSFKAEGLEARTEFEGCDSEGEPITEELRLD